MLHFPVIETARDLDLTPLYVTCEYYGPVTSYMPIATARFAFTEDEGVVFLLSSFDTDPCMSGTEDMMEDHLVCAAFNFFPRESSKVIRLISNAEGRCLLFIGSDPHGPLKAEHISGEDERGIYWGIRAAIPGRLLKAVYGREEILPGQEIAGNIFKLKASGSGKHLGAIAPFGGDGGIFDDRNLRRFEAVLM